MRGANRPGVVGVDDVRVRQLRGPFDLLVELLHRVGIGEQLGPDDFEGDDPAHLGVPGLEDLTAAVLAEALQQQVRPQHQVGRPVRQQVIDLERGQPAALAEALGQLPGVGGGRAGARDLVEARGRQDLQVAERVQEMIDGRHGHERLGGQEENGSERVTRLMPFYSCGSRGRNGWGCRRSS